MTNVVTKQRTRQSVPVLTDVVIVGAAVLCALITWFLAVWLGGVDLVVNTGAGDQQVGGVSVAVTAGVAALVGLIVLRILERITGKALPIWVVLAVVVTLVSLFGPLAATTAAAMGTLLTLHGVVAAVVIVAAIRSRRLRVR